MHRRPYRRGVKSSQTGDERLKDQVGGSGIRVGRALSRPEEGRSPLFCLWVVIDAACGGSFVGLGIRCHQGIKSY